MDIYLPRLIAVEAFEVASLADLRRHIEPDYYRAPFLAGPPRVLTRPRGIDIPGHGVWEDVALGNWVSHHATGHAPPNAHAYRVFETRRSFEIYHELLVVPVDPQLPEGREWCRSHLGSRRHVARYLTTDSRAGAATGRSGRSLCGVGAEDDERARYWASRRHNGVFTPTMDLPLCALCARAITPKGQP